MSRISIRYAKALFSLAQDEKKLDAVAQDLDSLKVLLDESSEFKTFVQNPLISGVKKADVLKTMFASKLNPLTLNFLFLLSAKKRVNLLSEILLRFEELLLVHRNQIVADLVSSQKLDAAQVKAIQANIEKITSKSVVVNTSEDKALLGGFTVRIEDVIIDNSVRYQLTKLKEKLIS